MAQTEAPSSESVIQRIWREYKFPLFLGSASILVIVFSIVLLAKSIQTTTPITFIASSATESGKLDETVAVDVEGAVVRPGVYRVKKGERVEEALAAAGGFRNDADVEKIAKLINRAAKVADGSKIYIPKIGEDTTSHNNETLSRRDNASYNVSGITDPSDPSVASLISINSASQSELESLPGVGPVIAGKIIAGRPYGTPEELVAKKVMSQNLFTKLQNLLSL